MEIPNTAIKHGDHVPGFQDAVLGFMGIFSSVAQAGLDTKRNFGSAAPHRPVDAYDPGTQSWAGEETLRYRVPLVDLPSERHARSKIKNIRILLDNVRLICINDQLPSTVQEREFWGSYRMLKYQLFLNPFFASLSVLYVAAKVSQSWLPQMARGRMMPVMLAAIFAEQYQEANFPAYDLLHTALLARTPLGDAARAEWQRLQPVTIPASNFAAYQIRNLIRDPIAGFQFGGNLQEALA